MAIATARRAAARSLRAASIASSLSPDTPKSSQMLLTNRTYERQAARLERDRYVRLHRIGPLDPPRGQPLRHEERQLQRLISIQTGVTQCFVATGQIRFNQIITAADTLGDVISGQLHVNTSRPRAQLFMHVEETVELLDDIGERASLVAVASLEGIAVHRITYPSHLATAGGDLCHDVGQDIAHLRRPHPRDERDPAQFMIRI